MPPHDKIIILNQRYELTTAIASSGTGIIYCLVNLNLTGSLRLVIAPAVVPACGFVARTPP